MNSGKILFACLMLVAGCADQESHSGAGAAEAGATDANDDALVALVAEDIVADNVIIDDNGSAISIGPLSGRPFGAPDPETGEIVWTGAATIMGPSGPTIVYIFKSVPDGASEGLDFVIEENTAYLLPYGAAMNLEALEQMRRIGPIDPSLTNEELAASFGVGGIEEGDPEDTDPKDAEHNGLPAYVEPTDN